MMPVNIPDILLFCILNGKVLNNLFFFDCCREFLTRLQNYQSECDVMINEIEQCLEFLTVLKTDYVRVATKTNALHEACENLLEDQVCSVFRMVDCQNVQL